jgi:hypothetical protein
MGGSIKSVAKAVPGVTSLAAGGDGWGAMKPAKDILLGKKGKATKDSYTQLDPLQQKALGQYGSILDNNTDQVAENAIAGQENQIRASGADAQRNAQDLVAQRGLGNSSVGLNAIINSNKNMGDQIGAARAMLPGLRQEMKLNNLNGATNGINSILNTRMFKQGQAAGPRTGGLAPLLGAGLGAAFGGPAGASVGMGVGNAMTQMG